MAAKETTLVMAARSGNLAVVEKLLTAGHSVVRSVVPGSTTRGTLLVAAAPTGT